VNVDAVFVLKVLMSEAPMTVSLYVLTMSCAHLIAYQVVSASGVAIFGILTYWMLVFERNSEWLRTYEDSLWLIIITAFTVGYGDIYPRTFPGRAISIAAGILGVIFAALGTAALSNKLSWTTAEFNVSKLLMKSVIEKKLAQRAVVYLQRTFRRLNNRESSHFCMSREAARRRDLQEWKDMKQEYHAFQQNQANMELLLKGILTDSNMIGKVTEFLNSHEATKEWISTVAKSGNHQLQLLNSVDMLEEQLKNLDTVSAAALEKQITNSSKFSIGPSAVLSRDHSERKEQIIDPNDGIVDSLIQELSDLCDVLDENNKDLEWFAQEIDTRVRGKRREQGPSWQSSAFPPKHEHHFDEHSSRSQNSFQSESQAKSNGVYSQFQPMNASGQTQFQNMPEIMSAIQQQAALQMEMQTSLMNKLFKALESPKRSRSRSRGRDRSLSRNHSEGRRPSSSARRNTSAHSHRSRSQHTDAAYSSDEGDLQKLAQTASSSREQKARARALESDEFSDDREVWIDEDQGSAASSRPNSRPISAASHGDAHSSEQATPRVAAQSSRLQHMQLR
jgi:hypothetical protein